MTIIPYFHFMAHPVNGLSGL